MTATVAAPAHTARLAPWLFVLPAVSWCAAVLLLPSLVGAGYAATEWDGLTAPEFVGAANVAEFAGSPQGRDVLVHTVVLAAGYVVAVNVVGLVLALGVNGPGRRALRAIFFLPAVLSPLVVGYIWKFVLDATGPLNSALRAVGLDGLAQPWLGRPGTALAAIGLVMVWQFAGYHMLIYLAGLAGVDRTLTEAAAVDGAGRWRRFRDITLPQLRPAVTIGVALSTISALTVFDQVMALTGGGPAGGTETLGSYIYKQAFGNGRYGFSAAVALVMVVFVAAVSLLQLRMLRRGGRR